MLRGACYKTFVQRDSSRTKVPAQSSVAARVLIQLLRDGHAVEYVALGGSMWPFIRGGSVVRVEPASADTLALGDVGAYDPGTDAIIVHRLRSREGRALVFRGDAMLRDDAPVPTERVLGRAFVVSAPPWTIRLPKPRDLARVLPAARAMIVALVRRYS
ncbi:MAG: hypothetical protein WCJ30_28835 [Deltaproteobacteria bacterium]